MLQSTTSIRPWWIHGKGGLPAPVTFTTKQSVATGSFYGTLDNLDWSALSLLERSQYLLLVLLAAVQIHRGRVPRELTPGDSRETANALAIERMLAYLRELETQISGT